MTLVSIIIPVYNAEKFISKCLLSVVDQTYRNIEILIINDASTDNSLQIINDIAINDRRIIIIEFPENKGNGLGRNTAIRLAKGEYILFVDADDWVENNTVELVIQKAKKTDSDIVLFGYTEHFSYRKQKNKIVHHTPTISDFESQNTLYRCYLLRHKGVLFQPWIYFLKRSLLIKNNVFFNESGFSFEDIIFSAKALYYSKNLSTIKKELYHYFRHQKSITHSFGKKNIEGRFRALVEVKQFLKDKNIFDKYKDEYTFFFIYTGLLSSSLDYFRMNKKDIEMELFFKDLIKSDFIQNFNVFSLNLPSDKCRDPKVLSYAQIQMVVNAMRKNFNLFKFFFRLRSKLGLSNF